MIFLATTSGLGGLFSALGLNWQAFILDLVAFLITCYVVGRWVLPPLGRALDAKKDELLAATRHEGDAKKALEEAEKTAAGTLAAARKSADEIIALAHADAAKQGDEAKARAEAQADRIIAEAREQLARDVTLARAELRATTAKLVAEATGTILGEKLDEKHDAALIGRSLEGKK